MNIMVAQDADCAFAQRHDGTQGLQRLRPTIDKVACKPEASVGVGGNVRVIEQTQQGVVTALQVADHPDGRGAHDRVLLHGARVWMKRRTPCWFSISSKVPKASINAAKLGTSAVDQGAPRLSMPTLRAS